MDFTKYDWGGRASFHGIHDKKVRIYRWVGIGGKLSRKLRDSPTYKEVGETGVG